MTPLLEARGLVKHLGGRRVVDGVLSILVPLDVRLLRRRVLGD